jgi:hypothetical protein
MPKKIKATLELKGFSLGKIRDKGGRLFAALCVVLHFLM